MRAPTWLRALHLFTVLTLLPLPLTPALAEKTPPPPLTDTEKAAPLYRTTLTIENDYALTRLTAELGVTVLHSGDGFAVALATSEQLTTLARLRYAPEGTAELGSLAASGTPSVQAVTRPLLARAATAQTVALAEGRASAGSAAATASLQSAIRGLSNDVRMVLAALPSSDTDGDGLTDTEERLWCTDPGDARSRGHAQFTDKDYVDRIRAYLLFPDRADQRIGGAPFQGWPPATSNLNHPERQFACADTDGDSVPDGAERLLGMDENNPSTDGDRYSDGLELFALDKSNNRMPSYVRAPGNHPRVAALPVIDVDIAKDRQGRAAFFVTRVTTIETAQGGMTQNETNYSTSKTEGTSTGVANTVTWDEWQEVSESLQQRVNSRLLSSGIDQAIQWGKVASGGLKILGGTAAFGLCAGGVAATLATYGLAVGAGVGLCTAGIGAGIGLVGTGVGDLAEGFMAPDEAQTIINNNQHYDSRTYNYSESNETTNNTSVVVNQAYDSNDLVRAVEGNRYAYEQSGQLISQAVYELSHAITAPTHTTTNASGRSWGGAQTTTHTQYEEQTVTNGEAFTTGENWNTATAVNAAHAANLRFGYTIRNAGDDWATQICNVTFNIFIGDDPIPAATYQVGSDFAGRDGVANNCFQNFEPGESHAYTLDASRLIPLSLDQMRAIDTYAPIRIVVEDYTLGTDDQLISAARGAGVMVAIEDGTDDGDELVDRYLIPTFGPNDKVQDVVARFFPHQLDSTGNIIAIWTPEYGRSDSPPWCSERRAGTDAIWCKHALSTADWWNIYLSELGDGTASLKDTSAKGNATAFFRFNRDTDLDGYSDRSEARLDTDPREPADHPGPELLGGLHCLAPNAGNVRCTLSLLNLGLYDAYGVEAVMVAPDDSITITNNTVGGSGRVRAQRSVVVGSTAKVQGPLAAAWQQAGHARPSAGGYYTGAADRDYTFTVDCVSTGGCAVGEGVWGLKWTDAANVTHHIHLGSEYDSPELADVADGIKLSMLSGRAFNNETFVINARTPRDTFQYTINGASPAEPIVIVSYNDPQGNHRFVLPNGPTGSMALASPTASLTGFKGKMLPDPGVEIVTTGTFAVGTNNTTNLVVNNPTEKTLADAKLFLEFIDPNGNVVLEKVVTATLEAGPTVVPVTWNTTTFDPGYASTKDYIVLAFLTDHQGNILDTGGRPLSSFQADPRPALSTDATGLAWDFGTAPQGTLLQREFALASTGFLDLRTYVGGGNAPEISVNGTTSRTLAPGDLARYMVTLNTHGLTPGPYTREIDVRSSDPDANQTITITGTILRATDNTTTAPAIYPLERDVVFTDGVKGEWEQFTHNIGPDPASIHPVKVLSADGQELGTGKVATQFGGAGNTSFDIFGNGQDGDKSPSNGENLNPIRASASGTQGQTALNFGNHTGGPFVSNTKVLIHQTRGTGAGAWEINEIQSVNAGQLTLKTPLKNTYISDGGASRAQVMHVSQWRNVTISAGSTISPSPWDGNTGGIVAVLASSILTVESGATVTATGKGFRGYAATGTFEGGKVGEGVNSDGNFHSAAANSTGGGGGGSTDEAYRPGGGGGSHASAGVSGTQHSGRGTVGSGAGLIVGSTDLTSAVMGGAGGSGRADSGEDSSPGGFGGGIIFLSGSTISLTGTVMSAGQTPTSTTEAAGSGGGAGGSILIRSAPAFALGSGLVVASGGPGGISNNGGVGDGGSGGMGRVRVEYCEGTPTGSSNPTASTRDLDCYIAEQLDAAPHTTTRLNMPETFTGDRTYKVQYGRLLPFPAAGELTTHLRMPWQHYTATQMQALVSNAGASSGQLNLKLFIGDDTAPAWQESGSVTFPATRTISGFTTALNNYMNTHVATPGTLVDVPIRVESNRQADVLLTNLILGEQSVAPRIMQSVVNVGADRPLDKLVLVPAGLAAGTTHEFAHERDQDDLASLHPCMVYDASGQTLKGVGKHCADFGEGTTSADLFGNGQDGNLTVGSGQTVYADNVRSALNGTTTVGQTSIPVASVAGFAAGQEVLVIQIRNMTPGQYEFGIIDAIDTGNSRLVLREGLKNFYTTGVTAFAQVLKVANYHDVTVHGTLTAQPWNGATGGVLPLRVRGTLTVSANGVLDVSGKGFRGGQSTGASVISAQGESIFDGGNLLHDANHGGGGGGQREGPATNAKNASGGGGGGYGANGTRLDQVGYDSPQSGALAGGAGGNQYGTGDLSSLIFLGSGGGEGGGAQGSGAGGEQGGDGGTGGGIIVVSAHSVVVAGNIKATGQVGAISPASSPGYGSGGGGSGGSILLSAAAATLGADKITAQGGAGGAQGSYGGSGGTGGSGRIQVRTCEGVAPSGSSMPAFVPGLLDCSIADQKSGDNTKTVLTLPEASGSGTAYNVQYGRRYSFASSGNATKNLRLRRQHYGNATLDALVSNTSGGSFTLSLDIGNNGTVDFTRTSSDFSLPVTTDDFAEALNAYIVAAPSGSATVNVPVRLAVSGQADVMLTNLSLTPINAKTRYLRVLAREYATAELDIRFEPAEGETSEALAFSVDIGADDSVEWASSGVAPFTATKTNLADAINAYLAGKSGEVDIPIRIIPSPSVTTILSGARLTPAGKPDVTLATGDIAFSDTGPSEGDIVTVTVTLHNLQPVASGPVTVSFFATPAAVSGGGTPSPVYIGATLAPSVPGSGSSTAELDWTTFGFTGAAVPVRAVVNPFLSVPETNETNNSAVKNLAIRTRADLTVADAGLKLSDDEPVAGQPVIVTITQQNDGQTDAPLSRLSLFDGAPAPDNEKAFSEHALAGETQVDKVFTWTPTQPGRHRLFVVSDSGSTPAVNEADRGNNQTWRDVYVGFHDRRDVDSGPAAATDPEYTLANGFGFLDANKVDFPDAVDVTGTCGNGQRAEDTWRRDHRGLVEYQFDHLLPTHFYHLDVVLRECDGANRQQTVAVDGFDLNDAPVDLSDQQAHRLSFRIDPALYADHTITARIRAAGIDGAVVSHVSLREVYYRYADAGSPAKDTGNTLTRDPGYTPVRGFGWLAEPSSSLSTAWGSAPLQSVRVSSGNILKYRFDGLQAARRYTLRLTFWLGGGSARTQKVQINDRDLPVRIGAEDRATVTTQPGLTAPRTDGTIAVPPDLYGGTTITVTITRTDAATGAFVNEIALEEETLVGAAPGIHKVLAGDGQQALTGATLPTPLAVEIRDGAGVPVAGMAVVFTLTAPAGSTGHRLTTGAVSDVTLSLTSNASGRAEVTLTLGSSAGVHTVSATCLGCSAPQVVTFQSTAGGPAGHHIEIVTPAGVLEGKTRRVLAEPLRVKVVDAVGGPLDSVAVAFAVTPPAGSGATAQVVTPASATTDAQGRAATTLLFGEAPGVYTVTATCGACSATTQVMLTATAKSAYQEAVKADAPVGYWPLNEAAGAATTTDVSGNGNTGTYLNGMAAGAGGVLLTEANRAAQSDGLNDAISIPDSASLSPTAAVSVETWVKLASYANSYPRLLSKDGSYELTMYTVPGHEGRLEWKVSFAGSVMAVETAFADRLLVGQWYHVAATYDGANLRIYLNGVEKAARPATGAVRNLFAPFTISRSDRSVAGTLDEVAVYGTALSPAAILRHYRAARPGPATTLTVASGNGQSAAVSSQLANDFVVTVTDVDGNLVQGTTVAWQIGTSPAGATGHDLTLDQSVTDLSGRAASRLTLGNRPGDYPVTARINGPGGPQVDFTATAQSSTGSLRLFFDPATVTIGLNAAPVEIAIKADSGSQSVDSVQFELTLDPVKLVAVDHDPSASGINLAAGTTLPNVLLNSVENANGRIRFAAGVTGGSGTAPSGVFTVATLKLQGVGAGATPLVFSQAGTEAFSQGASLPMTRTAGTVNVAERQLAFVAQPVRGAHGHPFGIQPQVELRDAGGALQTGDATTVITLAIKAGTGATGAALSCDGTVGSVTTATVSAGVATFVDCRIDRSGAAYQLLATTSSGDAAQTSALFNVTFAGDINGDCGVSLGDFSLLAAHFDKTSASSDWGSGASPAFRADINGNNSVGLEDFSILRAAFGQQAAACGLPSLGTTLRLAATAADEGREGLPLVGVSAGAVPTGTNAASAAAGNTIGLRAVASRASLAVGEMVDITVHAATGTQTVDAIEATVSYPTAMLEVVSSLPGTALPTVLANRTDAATGRVRLAVGQSLTSSAPSGDFVLAAVRFRATATGPATVGLVSPVAAYAGGVRIEADITNSALTITPAVPAPVGGGGGGGSSATPNPPTATATPTTAGKSSNGLVDTAQGGTQTTANVVARLPAGVVTGGGTLAVTVTETPTGVTPAPPSGALLGSTVFAITLRDSGGNEVQDLAQSATLTARFTAADLALAGGDPSRLRLQRFDAAASAWVDLGGRVDPATMTITATTEHFSLFAVVAALPVAEPAGPADGAQVIAFNPVLTWANPPGVAQYQLQVLPYRDDGPAINLIIGAPDQVAAARFEAPTPKLGDGGYILLPGMTYTWQVRTTPLATPLGEHDAGWSAWSRARTFRTAPPTSVTLKAVQPASKSEIATRTPVLEWHNSNDRVFYYEVQLSGDPQFVTDPATATAAVFWELVHGGTTQPLNSYVVKEAYQLEAGTMYYWRVRPRVQGDGMPVDWSETWNFRTR